MKRINNEIICRTVNECGGDLKKAASILGYHLRSLQMKIKNDFNWKLEEKPPI